MLILLDSDSVTQIEHSMVASNWIIQATMTLSTHISARTHTHRHQPELLKCQPCYTNIVV